MHDYIGKKLQQNTSSSLQMFWRLETQALMPLLVTPRENFYVTCICSRWVPDWIFEACLILSIRKYIDIHLISFWINHF